jgi:hypothetical protein
MVELKDWKSWLPNPNVWKSWMPEPKAWNSWTPEPKGRRSGMSQQRIPNQGVVKQDWIATGRIDFAARLNGASIRAIAADSDFRRRWCNSCLAIPRS